jgi:beta-N-acetylhexosaminidase
VHRLILRSSPHSRHADVRRPALLMMLAALTMLAACGTATARSADSRLAATATATTTSSPTPAAHTAVGAALSQARSSARVDAYLASMTLDEKLGQMFLIETLYKYYSPDVDNMVRNLHAGAMIVYDQNTDSLAQMRDYIATVQAHAAIPLMVSADEEGGVVDRLVRFEPPRPSAQDLAATGDPHQAWLAAAKDAHDLQAVGINTDLAPVVDVRTIPNAIEYTRLFGDNVSTVDTYAGAFLQGLQQNGEIACLKHWPGIGSTSGDPHLTLPVITRSLQDLESTDFAAFRNLLPINPGMIMVTHVLVPAIDPDLPATLSPKLVQGVLRGELGYDGVVMTDSLYMKGISDRYNLGEAAVLSVIAGDDLLEGAWDSASMTEMLNALKAAIAQGRISQARIDQSVRRILLLKQQYGLLPAPPLPGAERGAQAAAIDAASPTADLPHAGTVLARAS